LVKGKRSGQMRYMAWLRKQNGSGNETFVRLPDQSLEDIRSNKEIVEIDLMVSFEIADFTSIGISMVIGAFAVDIATLVNATGNPVITGYLLFGHLMMLIGILLSTMLSKLVPPQDNTNKNVKSGVAISLGILAMMLAFFAT
ncbi:MAG: hypothetical protein ACFFGZ_16880, partial [Candidatus Thorarchaeota archaeon]